VKRRRVTAVLSLLVLGCGSDGLPSDGGGGEAGGGTGATGDPCASGGDCAGGTCLPFPGGYCASDCSSVSCAAGEVCRSENGKPVCLRGCASGTDCRTGYMCFQSTCQPACTGDAQCGTGFGCMNGACAPLPGKAVGEHCTADGDCSSRRCDRNTDTCRTGCLAESDCAATETCFVNPYDSNNDGSTDAIQPICVKRRGGAPVGGSCKKDGDCDRGQCELGVCVTLCQGGGACPTMPPMSCVGMIAQVDIGAPKINACLFKSGTLTFDLGPVGGSGPVGMPTNAQSFNIYVEAKNQNTAYYAGITNLDDPNGKNLYTPPQSTAAFYQLPIRYQPSEGASMVLVSNSPPNVPSIVPGLWAFGTFAQDQKGNNTPLSARVRIKLGDAPATAGTIPLHVFITSLSGGCTQFDAASAPNQLGAFINQLRLIYMQANLTIDPIEFFDTQAASTFTQPAMGPDLALDAVLKQATAGDAADVLELVIVKRIGGSDPNFEILGVSGGVPGATGIPGTVHSGATASISSLCADKSGAQFAETAAHELGHSLGLFHNYEQDGNTDPLSDTRADKQTNLMYWEETSGRHLTAQQAKVLLANPAVK
jgi:hypothetical protein